MAKNESYDFRVINFRTALSKLYKITNGVMFCNTTTMSNNEEMFALFHQEIFSLWNKRGEKEPVQIISFCKIELENIKEEIKKKNKKKTNPKNKNKKC